MGSGPTSSPPDRLRANGRGIDPNFDDDEVLYRAVHEDAFVAGFVDPNSWNLNDDSVNRSKYSERDDVLIDRDNHVPVQLSVSSFPIIGSPPGTVSDSPHQFCISPIHKPLEENYSHSVLRCHLLADGQRRRKKPNPNPLKEELRGILSQVSRLA